MAELEVMDDIDERAKEAGDGHPPRRLLVVDDEPGVLQALKRQFRRKYDVHTAISVAEGERILAEMPIQVVISDQRMPNTTGVEFFSRIRHDYPHTIRVLITGYSDIDAVVYAINHGHIYQYIQKPWDPTELASIVDSAFRLHELEAEQRTYMADLSAENTSLEARLLERNHELELRNAELAAMTAELERSNREWAEFGYTMSHDFREPLRMVSVFVGMLADKYGDQLDTQAREWLQHAVDGSARMRGMLEGLLAYARVNSDGVPFKPVDVRHVVDEVALVLSTSEGDDSFTLDAHDLPEVCGDRNQLFQLFKNLIGNAIKYRRPDTEPVIRIATEPAGEMWKISVADNGRGFDPVFAEEIFDLFRRLSSGTEHVAGTGLGLAVCRQVVERHGGKIWAEGRPGQGATFTFTLPMVAEDDGSAG